MTAPRQLVLDLPARPALGRADFFVSPANALALAQVDSWPDWPAGRLAVAGPEGRRQDASGARLGGAERGAASCRRSVAGLDLAALPGDAAVAVEDADRLGAAPRRRRRRCSISATVWRPAAAA